MGISIVQRPQNFTPAFNDIPVVVQSTDYPSANFRFIGELKNADGDTIRTLKPRIYLGSTDKGVFNLQRILESYVNYDSDFDNDTPGYISTQNSLMYYELELGQEGGDIVVEHRDLTSITGWVFNAAYDRRDFPTYASGDVLMIYPATGVQFLTDQTKRIRPGQDDWLYYIDANVLDHVTDLVRYRSYNAAGTLLKTVDLDITNPIPTGNYKINKVPSGRNLINTSAFTKLSGTYPVIDPAAVTYTVQLYEQSGQALSEAKQFTLVDECSQYDTWIAQYLNRFGGFDSFAFDRVSREKYNTVRKQYKRQNYELNGSTYGYNLDRHAVTNYDLREQKTMVLNSDWLNDTEAADMRNLIASGTMFVKKYGTTDYIPVNVTNTEWETKKAVNEKTMFNCELTVTIADDSRRQSE